MRPTTLRIYRAGHREPATTRRDSLLATQPPIKTTVEDIDKLTTYLRSQVGWTDLDKVRKTIPSKHADNRKVEALRYLKLLDRDGANIKLTDSGRRYANGDAADKAEVLRQALAAVPLYRSTLDWLHYQTMDDIAKPDLANYWHDSHASEIGGAAGAALTDGAVFFLRMAGSAGLGQFVPAGRGRETHLKIDKAALEELVTGEPKPTAEKPAEDEAEPTVAPVVPLTPPRPTPTVTLGTGLQVNVEIHIAADAKAATIEEIFKNLRKYLIETPSESDSE